MMMKMSGFPPGFPPFFLRSLKTALISSNTQFWRGGICKNVTLGQKSKFRAEMGLWPQCAEAGSPNKSRPL